MGLIDFANNVPEKVKEWETIGEFFGIDVTEDYVWGIAKESGEIPEFHNIYIGELASGIAFACSDKYNLDIGVIGYYINSLDSRLYVNGTEALTRDDFFGYLVKHILSNVCIDENEEIDSELKIDKTTFDVGTPITEVWSYMEEHFDIAIGEYIGH